MSAAIYSQAGSVITGYTTVRTNLAQNPCIGGTLALLAGGRATITDGGSYVRATITDPLAGDIAQLVTTQTSSAAPFSPVAPGQAITLQAQGRATHASAMKVAIQFWDAAYNFITGSQVPGAATPVGTSTFAQLAPVTAVAPAGAAFARWLVGIAGAEARAVGQTFDVRRVMVEVASTALPYFDGSTPDALDPPGPDARAYEWAGTISQSSSLERAPLYSGTPVTVPAFDPVLSSRSQSRNRLQWVINRNDPSVVYAQAGLRSGVLELFYGTDEAAAAAAEQMLRQGTMFRLDYPERPEWEMVFVADGQIERELDRRTANHWTVTVEYQEIDGSDY